MLMFGVIVAGVAGPAWSNDASWFRFGVGLVIAIAGGVLLVGGMVRLGHSLTPFPRPLERARLQVGGAYRLVRHPIYGGLILIALGWSLISSPLALAATIVLAIVLEIKSRLEESMLVRRYAEYDSYRLRVRWRFLPGIH
jgi:protein-S-isoprenylcysteine O-methyltransferase Ste14